MIFAAPLQSILVAFHLNPSCLKILCWPSTGAPSCHDILQILPSLSMVLNHWSAPIPSQNDSGSLKLGHLRLGPTYRARCMGTTFRSTPPSHPNPSDTTIHLYILKKPWFVLSVFTSSSFYHINNGFPSDSFLPLLSHFLLRVLQLISQLPRIAHRLRFARHSLTEPL